MNTELKALLALVFDGLNLAQDAIAKKSVISMIPDFYRLIVDFVPAAESWSTLQSEILALPGSAQEADLVAFIEQKFGSAVSNVKAQAILAAVLKLIQDMVADALALQAAIKS